MRSVSAIGWRPSDRIIGYAFYVVLIAAGYYYNLTFVQLGLLDLGVRRVGSKDQDVAVVMGLFAVTAFVMAVLVGRVMDRTGASTRLRLKLRMLFAVVALQTLLTIVIGLVETPIVIWCGRSARLL